MVYVKKNLMTPTQAKTTDVIVAGGSFFDTAQLADVKADIKRIANALEELVKLRRQESADEELEDRIVQLFDKLSRRTKESR